ncbi:MAG: ATP-binding protein [Ignavibacteriales bacterium]|nr:ATP-binding protein [Ignavibacteriales bacterium]
MENQLLITLSRNKLLKNADISKIDLRNVRGQLITIGEGEILYREGDIAEIIYLVISGEINVLKKRLLGKTKSYLFSENDFFGHEEFFEETSRTSTAVALRDSYIISLTREEVDLLIQQDDEILINLREPVAEIDEEEISARTGNIQTRQVQEIEEPTWAPPLKDNFIPIKESKHFEEQSAEEISHLSIDHLNTPSDENINSIVKDEIPEEDSAPKTLFFDESSSLNEDGIPKAEFELPDLPLKPEETKKSDDGLNDALFRILSGTHETFYEPEKKKDQPQIEETDEAFLSSLGVNEEPETKKKTFDEEIIPSKDLSAHKRESAEKVNFTNGNLDFFPEVIDKETMKDTSEAEKITETSSEPVHQKTKQLVNKNSEVQIEQVMNTDELQMIIKAAELVNSNIRVDEVLKNIIDVATDLTGADRGTLYLVDKEKNELWSLITMGDEMREIRLKIGDGLAGFVAKSGETVNIKDVQKDFRFRGDIDRASGYTTRNMICFPIKNNKSQIIGVLQLLNSSKGEFNKRDEEFLAALSIHSAIALQNAELVEKLLQTERVQSLGKMANFLIQDIKKPILVSKRYAEHLRSKQLPADTTQIIDMLLEQLGQVADLVQSTSSYSEGKTILRTINVSLNNTLADYASRVEQNVESRNCKIVTETDKDVTVKLDQKEFFQCYTHIVKNACDAMPDGGIVHVSTKREDKKAKIYFKDSGRGIPEGFKEKIFEPFMTHGKKEGTGLGLSITRKVVEAHNGTIDVESSIGNGATFIITLPIASAI